MKKFGKTLVLAAALAMSMSFVTGCGEKKKESGTISESNTTTEGQSEAVDTTGMSQQEYIEYYAKNVTLGAYTGIKYENGNIEVTDEEVQNEIDSFVRTYTTYEEDKESEAKLGDTVNIDFVGTIDGVEFEGGNTQGAGYDLILGTHSFIDDFEDQIVGHKPGETFDVNVTFPEDYGQESLNGKDAVFETTLNYIKIPIEAEYNDELVAANTSYSNTTDYENSIREQLQKTKEANALASAQNIVMVTAINNATIESMPTEEISALAAKIRESVEAQAQANNIDYETFALYYYGYDNVDEFNEYIDSVCEENMKEKMVVCAIALKEGITVTDEEQNAFVTNMANEMGYSEDDIRSQYTDQDIMYYTLAEKVMQFMMDNGENTAIENTSEDASSEDASEAEAAE